MHGLSSSQPPSEPATVERDARKRSVRRALKIAIPVVATLAIVAPLAYLWQVSRVPAAFSVMEMGYLDYGGGPAAAGAQHDNHSGGHQHGSAGPVVMVPELIADPKRPADVRTELVAEAANLSIGGQSIAGFTVNGTTPGPTITVRQGQLVEVRVTNRSVPAGVSMHWHGVNVPNAMDGVAGVTQDAIAVGESFTYRFVAAQAGTLLVPLASGLQRSGARRPLRPTGRPAPVALRIGPARWTGPPWRIRTRASAPSTAPPATCRSRRPRASGPASG